MTTNTDIKTIKTAESSKPIPSASLIRYTATPATCTKRYRTILIDPPWPIQFDLPCGQGKKKQYEVMPLEEIKALPIAELADTECNLFCWTTHTYLPYTFELLKAWGFKYHCQITWDKGSGLVQFGFHRRTEFVLYAYRGRLGFEQTGKAMPTIIREVPELFDEPSTVHSRKPMSFYRWLERKTPEPRLELFARHKRPTWDVWGNEIENSIEIKTVAV